MKLSNLVSHYRRLMVPKKGRDTSKAVNEILRQRVEKLEQIERLRAEAAALFILAQELRQ